MTSSETESKLQVADYKKRIKDHENVFKKCMEYIYGFKLRLGAKAIFSDEEMAAINKQKEVLDTISFNVYLLDKLLQRTEKADYEKFMNTLTESLQSHLVSQILKNGVFGPNDTDRPLTEEQRGLLNRRMPEIVDELDSVVGEVANVCKDNCINKYHYQYINSKSIDLAKAEEMMDIMIKRSVQHYQSFLSVLKEKSPTAYELSRLEGIVATVDVKTAAVSGKEEDLTEADKKVTETITGSSVDESTVIGAETKHSVRLYLRYPTLESLKRLHELTIDKETKKAGVIVELLQTLFNNLLGNSSLIVKKVLLVDFSTMQFYHQCAAESADMSGNMSKHALLRNGKKQMEKVFRSDGIYQSEKKKILLKAFKWRMAEGRKLYSRPDLEAYETLASVCGDWRRIARDASFKEAVKTSRKQLREKYETIKLKCTTRITMNDEVACMGTLLEEVYVVTHKDPSCVFLHDPNKPEGTAPTQEQLAQESIQERKDRDESADIATAIGHSIATSGADMKGMIIVGQANLEKIEIADGIDISSVESDDEQTGLFCISRTDNSVWFWARSETRNKATAYKQFSPCTNITISPADKGHLRIVVLKDKNAVEMHNPSSELIQMMFLPDHVKKVNDILCNKDGLLIVCYGSEDNPLHRVSLIHRTGLKALLTYGNECGNGANELNNPSSIALDQENEILYVVDKGNERIVALDKHMDLINVVLDNKYNGTGGPVAVRFSKGSQRLLVAYKEAVEVFKVNRKLQPQQAQPQQQEIQAV